MNLSEVPNRILVASGKGGVGKTTVASDLARVAAANGLTVGLIDADISTPNSLEVMAGEEFDLSEQRLATHDSIVPPTVNGIQLVSKGVVLPDDVPLLRDGQWRAETVADYIENVDWSEDTDVVFIDTPPGTGEELQVIAAQAPPTHAFVVTTPHPSSVRDATKTHEFFEQMDAEHDAILNMAYIPAGDMVGHVLGDVDLTEVQQVGDARAEELEDLIWQNAEDFPLFGYTSPEAIDLDADVVATVPYTEDFDSRAAVYGDVLQSIAPRQEVEA